MKRDTWRQRHYCFWCLGFFPTLTKDHLRPRAFGGSDRHTNIVRACGPCNRSRGHIVGLYVQVLAASMNKADQRPFLKAAQTLKSKQELYENWVDLEKQRLGYSPTEQLGTAECPFPNNRVEKLRYCYLGARPFNRKERGRAEAVYRAIEYCRWVDDGGPDFDNRPHTTENSYGLVETQDREKYGLEDPPQGC